MQSTLDQLNARIGEVMDLRHAADLLEWDERVCMPPGGAPVHGEMLATLRRLAHEKFTSDDVGRLIENLTRDASGIDAESDVSRLVAVTGRDFSRATKVPAAFVAEQAQAVSSAQHAWGEARANDDFAAFKPHLERILDLKRRYVEFFPPEDHPYDVLLDDFEPGMKTADVKALFGVLRPEQVTLIREIASRPQVDDGCLRRAYAESDLWAFAVEVVTAFGFDWTRGRQDKSVHPFATSFGSDDVRITTRFVEGYPMSLLFGTLHETGHGLYEQGVGRAHHRTLLEGGASLGVHESQSRLWENIIGRSLPFWECFYPALQARFPAQLSGVTLAQFYRAINKVEPSLIRVEADEATYNLHVMLRVEMEIGMIEGRLEVDQLPDMWAELMSQYLGVHPTDNRTGVLQDIHWSAGLFGYFATYTVGNVVSAQLWDRFTTDVPGWEGEVRRGQFSSLLSWLRRHVHQHGRKYQPQDLVRRATAAAIDPAPYLGYLRGKYAAIYGL